MSALPNITPAAALLIEVRNVYGEPKAYPACPAARIFADIAGTKTLTAATLHLAQQLGYRVIAHANADWRAVR